MLHATLSVFGLVFALVVIAVIVAISLTTVALIEAKFLHGVKKSENSVKASNAELPSMVKLRAKQAEVLAKAKKYEAEEAAAARKAQILARQDKIVAGIKSQRAEIAAAQAKIKRLTAKS